MKAELIALRRDTAAIGSAAGVAVEPASATLTGVNGPLVRPCLACHRGVPLSQQDLECCFGCMLYIGIHVKTSSPGCKDVSAPKALCTSSDAEDCWSLCLRCRFVLSVFFSTETCRHCKYEQQVVAYTEAIKELGALASVITFQDFFYGFAGMPEPHWWWGCWSRRCRCWAAARQRVDELSGRPTVFIFNIMYCRANAVPVLGC